MNNKNNSALNSSTEHVHPFEPFVSKNTKTLILGTFPGKDFTDPNKENDKEDWYYGNKRNEFWELIEYALCCKENSLKTMKEKKDILEKHNIGIITQTKILMFWKLTILTPFLIDIKVLIQLYLLPKTCTQDFLKNIM